MCRGDRDFEPIEKQLAGFMLSLAHPARIAIVMRLAEEKDCVNHGKLQALTSRSQTLESHLKALRCAGLLHCNATSTGLNY